MLFWVPFGIALECFVGDLSLTYGSFLGCVSVSIGAVWLSFLGLSISCFSFCGLVLNVVFAIAGLMAEPHGMFLGFCLGCVERWLKAVGPMLMMIGWLVLRRCC